MDTVPTSWGPSKGNFAVGATGNPGNGEAAVNLVAVSLALATARAYTWS